MEAKVSNPHRLWMVVMAVAVALPHGAGAQMVAGTVMDHDTDAPVPQAEVSLVRDTQVVITVLANHAGRFQVRAPVPGRYVLRVERLGYEPATSAPLELESDRTTPVEVRLQQRLLRATPVRRDRRRVRRCAGLDAGRRLSCGRSGRPTAADPARTTRVDAVSARD